MGSKTDVLTAGVIEHDGMLWKPRRGSTTTAEEFIAARTLFMDLNEDAMWNAWVRDERSEDIDRAAEVMGTWQRAEPGHRHLTLKQWEAQQKRREGARAREREKQDKLRESRKPSYDTEKSEARLALLERQSRLPHERAELAGFLAGTKFPGMAPEKRAEEITKLEASIARNEAEAERLSAIVGDPESVIDENGWLPRDRRESLLLHYKYERERQVRRLKEELPELEQTVKEATNRSERSKLQVKLSMDTRKLEHLLAVPPLTPHDMCADCATPVGEHGWVTPPSTGPCPAWPGQVAIRKEVRALLEQFSRRREAEKKAATPPPPKPEPLAIVPSGLHIADVVAMLTELQEAYPDAEVRRGRGNRWELWAPQSRG